MAEARNYEEYRRQVLDKLGVEYYDEDIQEFDKWRLKVLSGLKDLFTEENIIRAVEEWLEAHPKYVQVPLADRDNIGGFKIEAMGEPPRPSVRLTTGYTTPYSDVSNLELPLIRDDGTMSPYFIPVATQDVKGAMSASDKAKLDSLGVEYDFETTLTPTVDTRGGRAILCLIHPKNTADLTFENAMKLHGYIKYSTKTIYPLITVYVSVGSSAFIVDFKSFQGNPQNTTPTTISGTLHIVAPFEINNVATGM